MTNLFNSIRVEIETALQGLVAAGNLPAGIDTSKVAAEPPRDPSHGDVATNAAMVLAREAGRKPRDLAALLAPRLEGIDGVTAVEIAGPGFINMRLGDAFWRDRLREILRAGTAYGESDAGGGRKVNVEYVSANPTGPLHIGHGRGAVFGDALANLLAKAGFDVTREYYVNDAGAQVDMLARSAHHRYLEALGEPVGDVPDGLYPGDYMKAVGEKLAADVGDRWRGRPEADWLEPIRETAIAMMLASIRDDLEAVGIRQEVFTSERAVVAAGGIERAVAALEAQGLIYTGVLEPPKGKLPDDWEPRPQMLFRSSAFGDDVDRPLRKSDGSWTYFASDIAYHFDKVQRGFEVLIDVWGADHGGYVKRVDAAVRALTGKAALDVKLCQLVRVMRAGELVRMSKRAGDFVTLREVVDEVGKDAVRFFMLTRKNDAPLDFDLARVLEQSRDNPVFYVQYAHARVCSVMRHARDLFPDVPLADAALAELDLDLLTDRDEIGLIKAMAAWPRLVEGAAEAHEPHRVAFFLYDLASQFHALWTRGRDESRMRFILDDEPTLTLARIALIRALATVVASGLEVFGVAPLEEMR